MKRNLFLAGLVALALFAGISTSQSQGSQSGSGAATDDQTTREIAEQINSRHAAFGRFDRNAYSAFIDPSAVFAEPDCIGGSHQGVWEDAYAMVVLGDDDSNCRCPCSVHSASALAQVGFHPES